ncbi:tetratricopeptide repeat protein [Clostridium sp. 19966]|uniref:tetratricopeptide repeat protein n=1 Tax=Clostridium sp. 19966 TaxID=2768166 RepID=UPI0028DE61BB|nr:tetratricopeptide repeat protein [Clostridium sp. 19966]MDT8716551.1 tetratricopeptide repeat protein [Clostridium sp. 19966]
MSYFEKANEFYVSKEYEKAMEFYKKAIDIKDNEAASYYNIGVCLIKLKEFNKAIAILKKAIELRSDSKYYFNLAYCYAMIKDRKKALIYFNTAWSIDNNDAECDKAINLIMQDYKKIH